MILYIISFVMIALSILERVLSHKQRSINSNSKNLVLMCNLVRIMFVMCILAVAYFVTDTNTGLILVSSTFLLYYLVAIANNRLKVSFLTSVILIFGMPLATILFKEASAHMLIRFSSIMMPLMITVSILGFSSKAKRSVKSYIPLTLGIGLAITILIFHYDLSNIKDIPKQEVVAEKFLNDELGIFVSRIDSDRRLRGEDTIVRAYRAINDTWIAMIYRDNSIISYEMEE